MEASSVGSRRVNARRILAMNEVMFGYTDTPCIEGANIDVYSGELVALVGQNGAAKSTLLKLALGLLKPWEGSITLGDSEGKPTVAYVPQQVAAFNSGFPSKVLEFVMSGCYNRLPWWKRLGKEAKLEAEQALRQVGMWEFRDRRIGELSGGQKQRMCIAKAIVQNAELLVLDEPTTGMDLASRISFYKLLQEQVKDYGKTAIMVTHSVEETAPYIDRLIELSRKEEGGWRCCTTTLCSGHFVPVG